MAKKEQTARLVLSHIPRISPNDEVSFTLTDTELRVIIKVLGLTYEKRDGAIYFSRTLGSKLIKEYFPDEI